jgi:hypothetical protein
MTPIRESAMTDRRQELLALTDQFVDAFNRMNLDDVVSFFFQKMPSMKTPPEAGTLAMKPYELPLSRWLVDLEAGFGLTERMFLLKLKPERYWLAGV